MKDAISIFKKPYLVGFFLFAIFIILTQSLAYQRYLIAKDNEQTIVFHEINSVKDRLKTALNYDLAAAKTLSFIIENYGIPKDFERVAKGILNSNKNIDAIQLTEKGVITHVYPIKGNEAVIGYDILNDSHTNTEAYKAIQKKELFFAGPLKLKQGGVAVIGRLPIFVDSAFFGFSAIIIKLPTLLKAAGIDTLQNNNFIYQLSKINPTTQQEEFFLSNSIQIDKEQSVSIEVPDGEWKLYAMSKNKNNFFDTIVFPALGFGLSFVFALFGWYLAKEPEKLNKLVDEKTAQLISAQKNMQTILNRINDGMISVDNEWRYTFLNDAALTTRTIGREAVLGKVLWDMHPGIKGTVFWDKYHEAMQTKKTVEVEGYYEPMGVWLSIKMYPSEDGLTVIYADITHRKQAEEEKAKTTEQLRQLNVRLQNIREEERTRISREIHDELGQQLTGIKMDISWIDKKIVSQDPILQKRISDMTSLIDDTVITVRRIASDLRPSILDDLGLISALEWQTQEFEKRTTIKSNFKNDTVDFNPEQELSTAIFRVYQEALTNIIRHAQATLVETTIEKTENDITLIIKDNGCGFDLNEVKNKHSLGLVGMNERVLLFNGTLIIKSEKSKGTSISLKIPLLKTERIE